MVLDLKKGSFELIKSGDGELYSTLKWNQDSGKISFLAEKIADENQNFEAKPEGVYSIGVISKNVSLATKANAFNVAWFGEKILFGTIENAFVANQEPLARWLGQHVPAEYYDTIYAVEENGIAEKIINAESIQFIR